ALALDNSTVDENQPVGTVVGNLSATDPEVPQGDSLTFSLPAGVDDNDLFQIGGVDGDELQLNFVPDFETQNSYTVEVAVTDAGGNEIAQSFTITIGDVDPESFLPPTDITLDNTAIDENATNPVVGTLSADDPEPGDTITFSLPNGFGDNDDFTIVGTELRFVGTPDFETQNSYSVQILATDLGGNTYSEDFTITVNNLFEVAPDDITLSNDTIAENSTDLTIGTLTATDPEFAEGDDTFTFSLPAGVNDNDLFTIAGDVLSINASPDFETQASYTLQIQVEDEGGNTFQETFTITVTNEFDIPPSALVLDNSTVDENQPVGTVVGNLSATDPEIPQGDSLTFSLPAGVDDNDLFQIGGANGDELQLNFVPDFEMQNNYTVQVVATDAAGNASAPQTFTINIDDIDPESILPPTDILLSANRVDENVAPGTTIGTLTAVDPDDTTGFTFSKIDTPGFDNDAFTVDGNELKIAISPDFEGKTLYRVRLQVADATGNDFQKDFLITVNDLPENREPTDIVLTSTAIIEESPAGSTVGSLITTDPDLGDTFTYTLVDEPGLDTASFTITNNQLTINDSPDFETQSSYRIKIRSTDAGGLFREEFFDILVLNTQENNPPTSLSLTGASVAENSSEGTVIGSFIGVDPDPGDNLTYTFVAGTGDADNDLFQIQGNQLRILESPDFEQQELYTIRVQGRDRQGNTIEEAFTISVLDQPESQPGTNSPILDLNGNEPGVNFAKSFVTDEPTTLMSPNATLTDPDSTNLVSAAVVISNPLDTPSEILEVDTSGTNIRAEYNTTGVLNLIGNAPLADYLQVLKTVTYLNLAPFETDEPRSLVFVLDDGVNTNEVASTELTPIIDNSVSGTNQDDPSLETTPRTDIINANGGNDTVTSVYENLLQQDEIDAGDGFDRFRLTNGSGSLFVDVTGGNQVSGISPTTIISNFEEFNFTGFQGTVQMTGGDAQVDRFIGGNGSDTLFGLDQGDFLSGGLGNDILDGGKGDDTLNGDAGNDLLTGGEGTDLLRGGTGNDSYVVSTTNGVISEDAGEGIDQVQASIGFTLPENVENLLLQDNASQGVGNASRNRIRGNSSNNRLFGSGGNDVLISLGGNDRLVGGAGNDRLLGGGDDDLLKGVGGDDRLIGGAGNDRLLGGGGNDLIKGIGGSDRLVGNAGNDRLLGGAGNDRLLGGGGNDRLVGNAGRNILIGNAGSDRFILGQPSSFNRVKDFNAEQNDKLVLIGRLSFGDVTLSQQGANTVVFLDNNRIALIEGIAANTLTASNFV
ncbi:cadherin domain-containing protein, partial [Vacuolonema iberomarrocanum]|uniref:cadherin domain-containing protein n=1 Tax=Vacuolonema iberomarrocanum TaxID=3454632 RepID=UPI001A05BB49|nr:cadherin domain-containing protein [filamentous cyanobacterium LEGE 07170]